jgi:hypothetical protein
VTAWRDMDLVRLMTDAKCVTLGHTCEWCTNDPVIMTISVFLVYVVMQ